MPIYEYECISCGERFELLRSISSGDTNIICPKCESKNVKKVISTFATFASPSSTAVPSNEACSPSGGT